MSRGHEALQLLSVVVAEIDYGTPMLRTLLTGHPMHAWLEEARELVAAAASSPPRDTTGVLDRNVRAHGVYCTVCDAIHLPEDDRVPPFVVVDNPEPEAHGRRRTG